MEGQKAFPTLVCIILSSPARGSDSQTIGNIRNTLLYLDLEKGRVHPMLGNSLKVNSEIGRCVTIIKKYLEHCNEKGGGKLCMMKR